MLLMCTMATRVEQDCCNVKGSFLLANPDNSPKVKCVSLARGCSSIPAQINVSSTASILLLSEFTFYWQ